MEHPAVHFEIIGADPQALRAYYGQLFGWEFDRSGPVPDSISEPGSYGFMEHDSTSDGVGIPGGVGGGAGHTAHTIFYIGVPEVGAALERAVSLGGRRTLGPEHSPSGLVVAHFTDPEGNLVGLAGPA